MKRPVISLVAAAVLTSAIPFTLSTPVTTVSAADTIKIMPVGDSITFGMGEDGGYRKYLYSNLTNDGYSIDMVGPEGSNSARANNITYDDNHAGYSGYQIKEIPDWGRQQGNQGSLYNKLKEKNAVKQAQPDIILLIIGTNDMTANRDLSACSNDLHDLVDYMLADMPANGMIFMGSIPEFTAYGGNAQRVGNYNNTVKAVAEDYQNSGKNVRFADVHGCLNGTSDLGSDNLHPNGSGYKKIGDFWASVVEDYLGGAGPVDNPPDNPPDDPPESGDFLFHYTFENGTESFTGRQSETLASVSTDKYAGSKCLSVTDRGANWNGPTHSLSSSTFKAGTAYSFSAVVKQNANDTEKMHLSLQYSDGGTTKYTKIATEIVPKGEWTQLANVSFTIPAGATDMQIYIETDEDSGTKCDFFVDEVCAAVKGTVIEGPHPDVPVPPSYKLGDVNGNGTISAVDLTLAKKGAKGTFANSSEKKMADVNCDGTVDTTDIEWFVQYLTGQVKEFPEPLTPPKGEMRPISEYTPVCEAALTGMNYDILNSNSGTKYGEVKKEYYRSKAANKDKPYNILLPANYDSSKQYPVLYILHGYYENEDRMMITGNNNEAMKTKELVGNLIAQGKAEEMIVVSPFVFTSATMNGPSGMDNQSNAAYDAFVDDIVDSLMPHIESKYSVATGRENTAVTGFSMGGRESLQIGMKYGDKFGYVGAACPAPGATGSWKWSKEEDTPSLVYITAGTADDVVGTSIPEGYHNNFTQNNVPHLWQVVQGGHHGDDSIRTHLYNFVQFVFKA